MKINVSPVANSNRFRAVFYHPVFKRSVSHGLGTDRVRAEADCRDAVAILSSPSLMADSESPRLMAYSVKAYEMAFGRPPAWAQSVEDLGDAVLLEDDDIARLATRVAAFCGRRDLIREIAGMLAGVESRRYRELFAKFQAVENECKVLRGRSADAERELAALRRSRNVGVSISIGDARDIWEAEYKSNHARKSYTDAIRCVQHFIESLDRAEKFPLADVRAPLIDAWRAGLTQEVKKEDGTIEQQPLAAKTKKRYLANVRLFLAWCQNRYDLAENAGKRVSRAAGDARHAEDIRAITRLDDLKRMLACLKAEPYWLPFVSMAVFAGPRASELYRMKIADLHLDEGHVRIFSAKTGRPRSVPIERTTLLPTLRAYLKFRAGKPPGDTARRDWDSPILFPSIAGENEYAKRTVSAPGVWVDRVICDHWGAKRKAVFDAGAVYADFGPQEWRHTFGTMLAHCKWSALQIAEAMGNSEKVVREYYVVPGSGGREWPYVF